MKAPEGFDLTGELPTGTHLLQASAGTGKTYAIAALTTRYVAEGLATIDQLLAITFGRAATQELRERIRRRLVDTAAQLRQRLRDTRDSDAITSIDDDSDELLHHLLTGTAAEVAARCDRLEQAATNFDRAAIDTTHAFCQKTLDQLGIAADTDPLERFEENVGPLTRDVVTDLYVARYGTHGAPPPRFSIEQAHEIARAVTVDPIARIDTVSAVPDTEAADRLEFAHSVRAEHLRRRRLLGIATYDDLLSRLDAALADPRTGATARDRLRQQYPVVMVDEFQDTDPLQWHILQSAFHGASTLILIGDPKQAIYAFRGGDVQTYLRAEAMANARSTLSTNHRTDRDLVRRITEVFRDIELGGPTIAVHPVAAAHQQRRLQGGHDDAPLRVRTLPDPADGKIPPVAKIRADIADDLTSDIVRLLAGNAVLTQCESRPVRPGDIAVLVDTNLRATLIYDTLRAAGVNAVVTGSENVFGSAAAHDWLVLLRAMEKPHRTALVRAAMIGPAFGFTVTDLAEGGDGLLADAVLSLRQWSAAHQRGGMAAVLARVGPDMTSRVLAQADGERLATDLRHVAEELHASAAPGLPGLIEWLSDRIADSATERDEMSRRLDTDADAVQIVTIHRSKGLEFPITYVPFCSTRWVPAASGLDHLLLHDDDGNRVVDVRGSGPGWSDNVARHQAENDAEQLRLLYVAFTRASCQVVTWWARTNITERAPLQRIIGARAEGATNPQSGYPTRRVGLDAVRRVLGPVEVAAQEPPARAPAREQVDGGLTAAPYDRQPDTAWRRTSYSALTAAAHEAKYLRDDAPGGEPDDERETETQDIAAEVVTTGVASPMADLPSGTGFGLLAHQIYEEFDTSAPDLAAELRRCAVAALSRRPMAELTAADLAQRFAPSVRTPLGPLADDRTLADVDPGDRLAELDFEFPLAGGDTPTTDVRLDGICDLLTMHLPADDPLAHYPAAMRHDGLSGRRLAGFLSGSIDAVLRVGTVAHPRFLVVDYKTNWIGGSWADSALSAEDYSTGAMTDAMVHSHYPLQALLYQVALHRFLRWRLPGYEPERHLGGALYLFVRGMCGPDTPLAGAAPCGVFQWHPSARLVSDLSDMLAGGP